MKLIAHTPSYDREYLDDFNENTLPNIGDIFEEIYVVKKKEVNNNTCELMLDRNRKWYKRYEEFYGIGE